jgi:tetratricopeptide (TPR) repeat protein
MPAEAPEDVELDEAKRRYIDDAYAELANLTFYTVLGVPRTADAKAIKNAYYRLAGVVHPDRYFGKRLGSYKPKMVELFTFITTAYETLSSAEKRAEYDAALAGAASDGEAAGEQILAPVVMPVDPRLAAKRQAALDGLKQHFADGKAKAKQYADAGARARAAGDVVAAAEAYHRALTFAPGDPALVAAYEETQRAAADKLAESHMKKALLEEKFGRWGAAAESWQRVMSARPNDPDVHARLANAIARAGSQR